MRRNKIKFLLLVLSVLISLACKEYDIIRSNDNDREYILTEEEQSFLDSLQYRTFLFFWHESNTANGLVKDRSTKDSPASIAATGFGIPAWAIGVEKKWITRDAGAERTMTLLKFLMNSEQSENKLATGYKGFYYHFLNMQTGKREWNCELSTIDTAWLLAGIRFASQYYNRDNKKEKEIRSLADSLVNRVDWNWTIIQKSKHYGHKNLVAMGYKPEEGLGDFGWFGYTEALYLYILAAGTNLTDPQKTYDQWLSGYMWAEPYKGLAHVIFPPLFGHQFSHMFIDFRGLADEYMRAKGIDYFENSKRATLSNRKYCIDNPNGWVGYDSLTWGISACDGPGDFERDGKRFHSYSGRGATGRDVTIAEDGTITPEAAAGSCHSHPTYALQL